MGDVVFRDKMFSAMDITYIYIYVHSLFVFIFFTYLYLDSSRLYEAV